MNAKTMQDQGRACIARRLSNSAAKLNNRGVIHLDSKEYEEAAAAFKVASKTMINVIGSISKDMNLQLPEVLKSTNDASNTSGRKRQLPDEGEIEQQHDKTAPSSFPSVEEESSKRPKTTHDIVLSASQCQQNLSSHILARPLWIRSLKSANSQSAIILYNLALTLHCSANRATNKVPGLAQSLLLYEMTKVMILKGKAKEMLDSPVLLVTIHNMIQIRHQLGKCTKELQCQQATFLRQLLSSCPGHHYELFYIRLLSVAGSDSTAGAA